MMSMRALFHAALIGVAFALAGCEASEIESEGWQGEKSPVSAPNPCEGLTLQPGQQCLPLVNGSCPQGMEREPPMSEAQKADDNGDDPTAVCITQMQVTDPDGGAGGAGGSGGEGGMGGEGGGCVPDCDEQSICGQVDHCGQTCFGRCVEDGYACSGNAFDGHSCAPTNDPCADCFAPHVCDDTDGCVCPPSTLEDGPATCSGYEGMLARDESCLWDFERDGSLGGFTDLDEETAQAICSMHQ